MKKLLLLTITIAVSAFFSNVHSQEFKKGLKAGANFATFSGDDIDQSSVTSYHAGLFARFTFTKIGVQAEALFSSQGADLDGDKVSLSYLHVPVLARINFIAGKLGIYLGPQFGYLLSADIEGADLPDGIDDEDFYSDLDVSGVIGAEFDVAAGLLVGARYYQSFSTIGEDVTFEESFNNVTSSVTIDGGDIKNSVFQLYVGYAF